MSKENLYEFMAHCKLGVLGSVCESYPQAALVGIAVTPQLEIIFDTVKASRKYRNLRARPACSFVIGWTGEQTVQYEGEARELQPPDLETYQSVYVKVWPDAAARISKWPDLVYFAVSPKWIRFSDFDQNPPLIEEFTF